MTQGEKPTLGEIARYLNAELKGDSALRIEGIASLREARRGQLSFLFSRKFRRYLHDTRASAVVLCSEDADECPVPCIITPQPRLAWAKISSLFDPAANPVPGIHSSAVVGAGATIGEGVSVGPNVVIAEGVRIGDGVSIGPGCVIGADCALGNETRLMANVTLYHEVVLGKRVLIHSGAVLGADGFGFVFDGDERRMRKIHQVYGVRVGDDVEIGAGTTIDRGALNHTVIGNGVKLDNQVQIGHNVVIGDHTVISGCSAVAGSTRIGRYCLIGGGVGIIDNVEIADRVEITAQTLVSQSIERPGRYSSGTGLQTSSEWRRNIVGFKKLHQIQRRLSEVERKVASSSDSEDQE